MSTKRQHDEIAAPEGTPSEAPAAEAPEVVEGGEAAPAPLKRRTSVAYVDPVKKALKAQLPKMKNKVCTALQSLLRQHNNIETGIQFEIVRDQMDKRFPIKYTVGDIKGDLIPNSAPCYAPLPEDQKDAASEVLAEWFFNCWKQIDGTNKVKAKKPWLPNRCYIALDAKKCLELDSGEWKSPDDEDGADEESDDDQGEADDDGDDDDVAPVKGGKECEECGQGAEDTCSDCRRWICEDCLVPGKKNKMVCGYCEEHPGRLVQV